jgi:uncharacterized SAM-binding protein YcdF (DUF218 family)
MRRRSNPQPSVPACSARAAGRQSSDAGKVSPVVQSRLLVADHEAAERVAIELARNRRIACPSEKMVLPGLAHLRIGRPLGAVVVVPGTAEDRDGVHTLTAEAFGRLRRAEEIARTSAVRAVILSGWSGPSARGLSEAEQMMQAWAGPGVPLVLDEAARTTAENALCTAAIIGALGEVRDVIVVASWANAVRLRFAFRAALRTHGLRPRLSVVWGAPHGASWRPGIVGLFRLRRHLLAGRAMLAGASGDGRLSDGRAGGVWPESG